MLSNEQCIEIVEKVWGWRCSHHHTTNPEYYTFITEIGKRTLDIESLMSLVNSWSGFGRTVETMAGKEWTYDAWLDVDDGVPRMGFIANSLNWHSVQWTGTNPTAMIKATHLAALEAIK